jgi:D-alanyl-D-alanine carboxypeptidase
MRLPSHTRKDVLPFSHLYSITGVCLLFIAFAVYVIVTQERQAVFGIVAQTFDIKTPPLFFVFDQRVKDQVKAHAFVVYDVVEKKVILGRNQDERMPLASITKIMTALTATSLKSATSTYTVRSLPYVSGDLVLKPKQMWDLEELVRYMLVLSSNGAANVIAAGTAGTTNDFVDSMNQLAHQEGLMSLSFTNPSGLDGEGVFGGTGTATDVARLFALASKHIPEILDTTTKSKATIVLKDGKSFTVSNTNQVVDDFVGITGSKTGFTDEAGGNLGIIVDVALGHPVVIVVLGSTRDERFNDVKVLYEATKKALR